MEYVNSCRKMDINKLRYINIELEVDTARKAKEDNDNYRKRLNQLKRELELKREKLSNNTSLIITILGNAIVFLGVLFVFSYSMPKNLLDISGENSVELANMYLEGCKDMMNTVMIFVGIIIFIEFLLIGFKSICDKKKEDKNKILDYKITYINEILDELKK